jgi:hypothetical protein
MSKAYINLDLKLSFEGTMPIEEFTTKVAALMQNGTIRDAFDAAGFTLEDVTLACAEHYPEVADG